MTGIDPTTVEKRSSGRRHNFVVGAHDATASMMSRKAFTDLAIAAEQHPFKCKPLTESRARCIAALMYPRVRR